LQTIVKKVVEKTKSGDLVAAKLLFDRLAPPPKSRAVAVDLSAIGEYDGIDSILAAYRTIVEAVAGGELAPAEGLELVALIEAQRAAVKELRPAAMYRKPTPEEAKQQRQRDEAIGKVFDRFNATLLPP
jgi:hypothetical protein